MYYGISSGASVLIFWAFVIIVAGYLAINGMVKLIQSSNDEAKADAYIKRVMGEGRKKKGE